MSKRHQSSFKGKVRANAERKKREATTYSYLILPDNVKLYKPTPGKTAYFDILPYTITDENHPDIDAEVGPNVDDLWYKRPYKIHVNVGVNNDVIVCPTSFGKKCPICDYQDELRKRKADKEDIKALYPKLRNLYVVIPKRSKDFEDEIHIFDISEYNFQKTLYDEIQDGNIPEEFCDLEDGCTLKVRFDVGQFGKDSNPFPQASRADEEERDEQYDESILEDVPNLDEVFIVLSYKEIEAKFFEVEGEEETEEVVEDNDRKRKTRTRTRKEPEPEDEKDKGDEKPTHKRRGMMVRDREEEEEKPTRSRSRKSERSSEKDKCPHGYKFGEDTDQYDECNDCEIWEDCDGELVKSKKK